MEVATFRGATIQMKKPSSVLISWTCRLMKELVVTMGAARETREKIQVALSASMRMEGVALTDGSITAARPKKLGELDKGPPPQPPLETRLSKARWALNNQDGKLKRAMDKHHKWQQDQEQHWEHVVSLKTHLGVLQAECDKLAASARSATPPPEPKPTLSLSALLEDELDGFVIDFGDVFSMGGEEGLGDDELRQAEERRDALVKGLQEGAKKLFADAATKAKEARAAHQRQMDRSSPADSSRSDQAPDHAHDGSMVGESFTGAGGPATATYKSKQHPEHSQTEKTWHFYFRNLSTWGPAATGLMDERHYDGILLVETHVGEEHSDDLLRHWSRNGYKATCAPARPTDRAELSGGAVAGMKNTFTTSSSGDLAMQQAQQIGMRDIASTRGNVDFHDFVPIVWHINGTSICIVAAYLTCSIGIRGISLQKLAILGSFIKSLDIPWAIFADWNVPPSTLMQTADPTGKRSRKAATAADTEQKKLVKSETALTTKPTVTGKLYDFIRHPPVTLNEIRVAQGTIATPIEIMTAKRDWMCQAHTPVTIKSWVDDLNTRITTPPKFAVDQLTEVATILRADCKELDLIISPKSNILSSTGYPGAVTAAMPCVSYAGKMYGTPPSVSLQWRRALGRNLRKGSSQRSLTTQLQLDMGHSDPAITTAMDVINSWALFLATSDVDRRLIETTWAGVVADTLVRQQSTWSRHIWGICSATVRLLPRCSRGPLGPWRWASPDGIEFFAPPEKHEAGALDFSDLKQVFSPSIQRSLWAAASDEYPGLGLERGIPDIGPLSGFQRSLERKGERALFGDHQAIATGNLWPAQRVHDCYPEARWPLNNQDGKLKRAMDKCHKWQQDLEQHWEHVVSLKTHLGVLQAECDKLAAPEGAKKLFADAATKAKEARAAHQRQMDRLASKRRRAEDSYGEAQEHSDDLLRHWSKNGYKAICAPARPTDRTKLSGGAVVGMKNTFTTSSSGHLAINKAQQIGMRDIASTRGNVDFHDFVPIVWHSNGTSICIAAAYLTCSIGVRGTNLQKLAILGSFIKSLDIPWAIFADWNVPPSTLMQKADPTGKRSRKAATAADTEQKKLVKSETALTTKPTIPGLPPPKLTLADLEEKSSDDELEQDLPPDLMRDDPGDLGMGTLSEADRDPSNADVGKLYDSIRHPPVTLNEIRVAQGTLATPIGIMTAKRDWWEKAWSSKRFDKHKVMGAFAKGSSQRSLTTQLQLDMGHSDPAITTAMDVMGSGGNCPVVFATPATLQDRAVGSSADAQQQQGPSPSTTPTTSHKYKKYQRGIKGATSDIVSNPRYTAHGTQGASVSGSDIGNQQSAVVLHVGASSNMIIGNAVGKGGCDPTITMGGQCMGDKTGHAGAMPTMGSNAGTGFDGKVISSSDKRLPHALCTIAFSLAETTFSQAKNRRRNARAARALEHARLDTGGIGPRPLPGDGWRAAAGARPALSARVDGPARADIQRGAARPLRALPHAVPPWDSDGYYDGYGEYQHVSYEHVLKTVMARDPAAAFPTNMVFSSTAVVSGSGVAEVRETGMRTQVGLIAKELKPTNKDHNPLQKSINMLGAVIGVICVCVVFVASTTSFAGSSALAAGQCLMHRAFASTC
ncbi:unnamed protein product [Prorocentrum cordatum]|uniref:Uncharacterized protein n=1 Tax=Prorocentrum cordatum TaxID=2364126 RepID=A0ABN9RRC0_9DINO|nr:unnamed protein product [Polarella glacialis]